MKLHVGSNSLDTRARQARLRQSLRAVLRHREAFLTFVHFAQKRLEMALELIELNPTEVRRIAHVIKSNADCYALDDIIDGARHIEMGQSFGAYHIEDLRLRFYEFLEFNKELLLIDYEQAGTLLYELRSNRFGLGYSPLDMRQFGTEAAPSRSRLEWRPVTQLLGPISTFVSSLAKSHSKAVDFHIEGADLVVDATAMSPVLLAMIFAVRNAIEHGIESRSERRDKPPRGRVLLRIGDEGQSWRIDLVDDGRGIQTTWPDDLSTGTGLASGLGLPTLAGLLERHGGEVQVESRLGFGTRMTVHVPKPETLAA